MLLRYLEKVTLEKITKIKQANGTYIDTSEKVDNYNITKQTIESEVDAQIYGADINKMLRLTSPHTELETYLLSKLNNSDDNISKYRIIVDGIEYKIKAVTPSKVDIERL